MSLCVHGGVNAGIHLCVACAWRDQSVLSHKLPVLFFFFKALSPDGARSHQFSYTGWPGSPRDHLASILPVWSCKCHFFGVLFCFVLCGRWRSNFKLAQQALPTEPSHLPALPLFEMSAHLLPSFQASSLLSSSQSSYCPSFLFG